MNCACGCGSPAKRGNRYIVGHSGGRGRVTPGNHHVVRDRGHLTECWEWLGGRGGSRGQYGRAVHHGRNRPAHHVYLERSGRTIPEGMEVDHLCHNPLCVNPDHLEVVTGVENRRRQRNRKLTERDAQEIRAERERLMVGRNKRVPAGSRLAIAARYGVCPETIRDIWRGKVWAQSTPAEKA